MKKLITGFLTLICVLSLVGCQKTSSGSEVYSFPEPTTQIKVSYYSQGAVSEITIGSEEYNPDDVPLAFQNTEAELVQNGHDYWEWKAESDNHGSTSKIMECWYYFEASFKTRGREDAYEKEGSKNYYSSYSSLVVCRYNRFCIGNEL